MEKVGDLADGRLNDDAKAALIVEMGVHLRDGVEPAALGDVIEDVGTEDEIEALRTEGDLVPDIVDDLELGAAAPEIGGLPRVRLHHRGGVERGGDGDGQMTAAGTDIEKRPAPGQPGDGFTDSYQFDPLLRGGLGKQGELPLVFAVLFHFHYFHHFHGGSRRRRFLLEQIQGHFFLLSSSRRGLIPGRQDVRLP